VIILRIDTSSPVRQLQAVQLSWLKGDIPYFQWIRSRLSAHVDCEGTKTIRSVNATNTHRIIRRMLDIFFALYGRPDIRDCVVAVVFISQQLALLSPSILCAHDGCHAPLRPQAGRHQVSLVAAQ